MTITFEDGRVRLDLKPSEVLTDERECYMLFDAVADRLHDMGVVVDGFSVSIVVDYLDDRK